MKLQLQEWRSEESTQEVESDKNVECHVEAVVIVF